MFGMFKAKADEAAKRVSGKTDVLEGGVAIAFLAAAADGSVSDDELAQAIDSVKQNKLVGGAFTQTQIEEAINKQANRIKTPSGRVALQRELDDLAKYPIETREDIYLIGLDVAYADGSVSPEEKVALDKAAGRLGVDPRKFDA